MDVDGPDDEGNKWKKVVNKEDDDEVGVVFEEFENGDQGITDMVDIACAV